jgi:hypothetical protein
LPLILSTTCQHILLEVHRLQDTEGLGLEDLHRSKWVQEDLFHRLNMVMDMDHQAEDRRDHQVLILITTRSCCEWDSLAQEYRHIRWEALLEVARCNLIGIMDLRSLQFLPFRVEK